MICWALLRFIRSSIHAPLSAGQNKSEAMHRLHWSQEKRKEAKLDWCSDCFCRDCYSWQGHLKVAKHQWPWGKLWPILSQDSFSLERPGRLSAQLLIHLMAVNRYGASPLASHKVHRQIEAMLWLMSTDVFPSPCPSVGWIMLSWTAEGPCLSSLAVAVEERNSRTVCDTEWVWHRP